MKPEQPSGDQPRAVMTVFYDPATGAFGHNIEGGTPIPQLVNHLSVTLSMLIDQQKMAMYAQRQREASLQKRILLPDGTPAPIDP